ncbi:hypothetical protein BDV95DRAFT_492440 [Massariosphaeria phaeospora]|uniref:C2H2-type domain-containing protein n=1 Tax=Massariosphaeria phaeospora TaxID=100035 RepID=A0A7C8M8I2_9PLEO|nr:hypothetical protein BDV95DRAFT_492440 [Massariosphaeria phaeospora]
MPPGTYATGRRHIPPDAVKLFNCAICNKGYPRQIEFENHLRSYDHNHRQRLADLKKITAANEESARGSKAGPKMRNLPLQEFPASDAGMGPRFKKVGTTTTAPAEASGSRFKKVGVVSYGTSKESAAPPAVEPATTKPIASEELAEAEEPAAEVEDSAVVQEEEEVIDYVPYDFTKPTGCDHATCPGCKTEGMRTVWDSDELDDVGDVDVDATVDPDENRGRKRERD